MNIVENAKQYLNEFIQLNEQWITKYFELEEADKALAKDPYKVVRDGGYIFCLVSEGQVLGTCALFKVDEGVYELARMAVSEKHQGQGFSHLLMNHCLAKLSDIQASSVYLVSNTQLKPAIELYKKHGFISVSEGQHPVYSRANIVMERHI